MWLTPKNAPLWQNGCIRTDMGGVAHAWGSLGLTYPQKLTQCHTNSRNTMYLLGILYNNTLGIALSITGIAHYLGNVQELCKICTTFSLLYNIHLALLHPGHTFRTHLLQKCRVLPY